MRTSNIKYLLFIWLFTANSYAASWLSVSQLATTMQQESSAMAITVKQTAISANQEALGILNTAKTVAVARGAIQMTNRVVDAFTSFEPVFGQSSTNSCLAHMQNSYVMDSSAQSRKDAMSLMQNFTSKRISSQAAADTEIISIHKDVYCTVGEAKAGSCTLKPNGMQGWDSNYSGAFTQRTMSPDAELAAYAYTAMITDTRAPQAIDCKSASCQSASLQQLASSSVASMAANSFIGQITDRRIPELTSGN
ncbi:TPA: hypothetical protein U5D21_002708 [Yersinia enterocolitica]|nr:hypothetical protein [Yersinia enterocolitica]